MVRVLPVDVLRDPTHVHQQLVEHAAVVEEDQVEHQSQRRGGDDDGEEIQRAEQPRAHPDGVHQQRQDQRDAHLEHHRTDREQHRVLQRGAQLGVSEQGDIVGVPRIVQPLRGRAQTGDLRKAVDHVLDEGIVQKEDQEGKGRDKENDQRAFALVEGRTRIHADSLPLFSEDADGDAAPGAGHIPPVPKRACPEAGPWSDRGSVECKGGGHGLLGAHGTGHYVLDIGEQVGLSLAGDGVLHGAHNAGDVGVGVRSGLLEGVQAGGRSAVDQSRDLGGDEGGQDLIGGHMLDEGHGGVTFRGIVPGLLGDEVAHGDAADRLAGNAVVLGGDVRDGVAVQAVGVVLAEVAHLPGAVDQERCVAVAEQLHGLSVRSGQGIGGEEASLIQVLQVVQGGHPLLAGGVVHRGGDVQLVFQRAVVHNAELEPVVRDLEQRAGDGRVALILDGLAVDEELVPGVVGAGDRHAAVVQDVYVDEQVLPEAGGRDGVVLAVGGHRHHGITHVGGVLRVFGADGSDVHHLAGLDEGLGVGVGEEEQHVRLRAGLEIGQDLGLPFLIGGGRSVQDGVAGGRLVGRHRILIVLAVTVVAAVGGNNGQLHLRGRGGAGSRLAGRRAGAGSGRAAGTAGASRKQGCCHGPAK